MNYLNDKCNNESAIKLAEELKSLGVKNNDFFLKVYDKDLIGVNPHDENLSDDMKMKVLKECKKNIYYYLTECVRKPDSDGKSDFLIINRMVIFIARTSMMSMNTYIEAPRQLYRTWSHMAMLSYKFIMSGDRDTICNLSSIQGSKWNVSRMRDILTHLPDYINTNLDISTSYVLGLGTNRFRGICAEDRSRLDALICDGKGNIFIDEISSIDNIQDIFKDFKLPNFTINIAGVPPMPPNEDDIEPNQYTFLRDMTNNCTQISDLVLYDMTQEELIRLGTESKIRMLYTKFQYDDLGQGVDYLAEMYNVLKTIGGNMGHFSREVLINWDYDESHTKVIVDLLENRKS